MQVLPYILLPLAGPEEFSDEDNEMFPTELQVHIKLIDLPKNLVAVT